MIPEQKASWKSKIPEGHPQWAEVGFAEILSLPSAYLAIGYSNRTPRPGGGGGAEDSFSGTRDRMSTVAECELAASEG